jgi:hypothetical protein
VNRFVEAGASPRSGRPWNRGHEGSNPVHFSAILKPPRSQIYHLLGKNT